MATITGTPGPDALVGTLGNDTISGLGGGELISADFAILFETFPGTPNAGDFVL